MKSFTKIDRLTEDQSAFAAENYPLIHKFLKDYRLKEDDFFDVVVFGYARYFLMLLLIFQNGKAYHNGKWTGMLYFVAENGDDGILMPLKPPIEEAKSA